MLEKLWNFFGYESNSQEKAIVSHKKQAFGKVSCGWCKTELVRGMVEAIRIKKFSYKRIYPSNFKGNKVPRSTLSERLNEMAKECSYHSFSNMMEQVSDQQLFNLCNEATLEKMKCTEVRVRGLKTYLSTEQELVLATFLNYLSIDGAALDFEILRIWLHELIIFHWNVDLFGTGEVSRGWYTGFMKRHPFIKQRVGRTLEDCRLIAEASIVPFFNALHKRMKDVDPRLIGNLDESMCSCVDKHIKVIGSSLATVARRKGMESQKPHISILPVVSGAGRLFASLIVEGTANANRIPHVPEDYQQDDIFHYGATTSGFIEMHLFEKFMICTVIRAINQMREFENLVGETFYLFMDNLPAHRSIAVSDALLANNIVVMFFPPHTSHILQPEDRGIFHVAKRALAKALFHHHTLCGTAPNIGTRVKLIKQSFLSAVTPEVIKSSFRHAGIYPIALERAKAAMDGAFRHGMEHAPPTLLRADQVEAANIWGDAAPQVLAAQDYALEHGGVYTVTTVSKRGNVKCSVTASPDLVVLAREARDAFKTIVKRATAEQVPNNPMEFYFSDDPEFTRQNQALIVTRAITKLKWVQDIVPILMRMEEFGIEEISDVLHSTDLVPEKRAELIDIMTDRYDAFLYFFSCEQESESDDVEMSEEGESAE